jgi:hypothetical protein
VLRRKNGKVVVWQSRFYFPVQWRKKNEKRFLNDVHLRQQGLCPKGRDRHQTW